MFRFSLDSILTMLISAEKFSNATKTLIRFTRPLKKAEICPKSRRQPPKVDFYEI